MRKKENRDIDFVYGDDVVDAIAARCIDVDSGTLLPEMSCELLSRQAQSEQIKEVKISKDGEG